MPYQIIRADITKLPFWVDAIVCPAHRNCNETGTGVANVIHCAAGPVMLERRKFQGSIADGEAIVTPSFGLSKQTDYIIHTVPPVYNDDDHEKKLKECYVNSLTAALANKCTQIAFPLLGCGNRGFPIRTAYKIATNVFADFCENYDLSIWLVILDQDVCNFCKRLHNGIRAVIDEEDAIIVFTQAYTTKDGTFCIPQKTHELTLEIRKKRTERRDRINKLLEETPDATFSQTMLAIQEKLQMKASDIYLEANITAKHFSKIKNDPEYVITKKNAIAIAAAFQLNLPQTTELLKRAGLALQNNQRDRIIAEVISEPNYCIDDIFHKLEDLGYEDLG